LPPVDWHPSRSSFERGQKSESRRGVRVEKNFTGNADSILNIAAPLLLRGLQMQGREGTHGLWQSASAVRALQSRQGQQGRDGLAAVKRYGDAPKG
jgi:hypothetical protein